MTILSGVADRGFHLIGGLPFFNLRRFGRRRLLLRLSSTLIVALLVIAIAALLSAALIGAIIEREQSGDRVFYR